jgi:hypothetical protein
VGKVKILFLSQAGFPDYQHDVIFHGGRSLLGEDFIDYDRIWYQYKYDKEKYWDAEIPRWNQIMPESTRRAMSLYGLFENDNIDRTDIDKKIKTRYFDFVIIGSVHRLLHTDSSHIHKEIELVSKTYPKEKTIFIDGEDDSSQIVPILVNKGFYFKRELNTTNKFLQERLHPIHFGIPKEKILRTYPEKNRVLAHLIPGEQRTYIYKTEEEYYHGYQESYFGMTIKKGGWDCMRHYEILANRCIPYFPDLIECPKETMHRFPKDIILESNKLLDNTEWLDTDRCMEIENTLYEYTKKYLTTESVMKYVLDVVNKNN